jgi:hypothetical protein
VVSNIVRILSWFWVMVFRVLVVLSFHLCSTNRADSGHHRPVPTVNFAGSSDLPARSRPRRAGASARCATLSAYRSTPSAYRTKPSSGCVKLSLQWVKPRAMA